MSYIALKTLIRREFKRILRTGKQDLIVSVITVALYFVIFGQVIGSRVGFIDGVTYVKFITPGLIIMVVITNAYTNTLASFFGAKFQKYIEEMRVSPIPHVILLLGFVLGGVMRGLLVGIAVFLGSLFFLHFSVYYLWITALTAILTAILFSLAGLINGIYAKSFDSVFIFPAMILTPLVYFAGIFYSAQQLPVFWRNVSHLDPILIIVNTFRYGMLGMPATNIYVDFCVMTSLITILFFYTFYLLNNHFDDDL